MKQKLIDSKYVFNKFRFYMKQKNILLMLCLAMSGCSTLAVNCTSVVKVKVEVCPIK